MTDIDFDELDKAVSSVLGPRSEDKTTVAPQDVASAAPAAVPEPVAEDSRSGDSPKIVLSPRPRQPLASPAAKRSGRFMDMVHPSSDMASEKEPAAPAPRVRIMPTENAPKPEASTPEPSAPEAPKESPETPAHTSILDAVLAPASSVSDDDKKPAETKQEEPVAPAEPLPNMDPEYPDPIDVAGPLSIAEEPPKQAEHDDDEVGPDAAPTPEVPFLPDAKVEKRPLGGFAADETPEELELLDKDTADESQLPPEASLPAALQSDVVAVESDALPESQSIPDSSDEKDEEESKPTPKHEEKEVKKSAEKPSHHDDGVAQSIPQQYRAEPAVADEAPRPVFDTDQYHQPLIAAHAGKKNHAWMFILLVTALLAVGGTLGYFAFMSGL